MAGPDGMLLGKSFYIALKVTDWFPKEITPAYEGIYRTKIDFLDGEKTQFGYSYWKDGFWGAQCEKRADASPFNPLGCNVGLKAWRGLSFDPSIPEFQPDTLHAKVLNDIAVELDMSKQAVSKLALAYYQRHYEEVKKGHRPVFLDEKGYIIKEMSMLPSA